MAFSIIDASRSAFEVANTAGGKKVAIAEGPENPLIAEFQKESDVRVKPEFEADKDKVFRVEPSVGTLVPKGTKVNLVIMRHSDATFGFFPDTHLDLKTVNMTDFYRDQLKGDAATLALVDKFGKGETLASEEVSAMEAKLEGAGIKVDSAREGAGFDEAMIGLVLATKFGT